MKPEPPTLSRDAGGNLENLWKNLKKQSVRASALRDSVFPPKAQIMKLASKK